MKASDGLLSVPLIHLHGTYLCEEGNFCVAVACTLLSFHKKIFCGPYFSLFFRPLCALSSSTSSISGEVFIQKSFQAGVISVTDRETVLLQLQWQERCHSCQCQP